MQQAEVAEGRPVLVQREDARFERGAAQVDLAVALGDDLGDRGSESSQPAMARSTCSRVSVASSPRSSRSAAKSAAGSVR